jgi:hypothetical protein
MTWKEIGQYFKNASQMLLGVEHSIRYFIGNRVDEEVPEFLCVKIRGALGELCFAINEMLTEIHILACGDAADDVREDMERPRKHADEAARQSEN